MRVEFRRWSIALLAATAALTLPAARALEWVSERFEGATAPLQTTLDVAFSFKNTSDKPVTIRAVQTNCDCLGASANKSTFAPGESGVVTARFTVGDRIGTYERAISVVTDDAPTAKRLSVRIEVPEAAVVTPNILLWPIGSPGEEKSVDVRSAAALLINFTETFATNTDFQVRLETVEAGRHYRMHIKPGSTQVAANAAVRLKGATPEGQVVIVSAYANVR